MKFLSFQCQCGRVPKSFRAVGLTGGRQLAVHWRCSGCRQYIYVLKDLEDCWRECPAPAADSAAPAWESETEDDLFLRKVGIRPFRI